MAISLWSHCFGTPCRFHALTVAQWLSRCEIVFNPSERADPLEREEASATDALAMAEDVTKLPLGSSERTSQRQPPTVSDTTAAAFPSSTLF